MSTRSCLQLITDCPSLIQEELDLISALSRLEQFGVKILPLQGNAALTYPCNLKSCPPSISFERLVLKLTKSSDGLLENKPLVHLFEFMALFVFSVWIEGKKKTAGTKINGQNYGVMMQQIYVFQTGNDT